jgi:hypothetical protein
MSFINNEEQISEWDAVSDMYVDDSNNFIIVMSEKTLVGTIDLTENDYLNLLVENGAKEISSIAFQLQEDENPAEWKISDDYNQYLYNQYLYNQCLYQNNDNHIYELSELPTPSILQYQDVEEFNEFELYELPQPIIL